MAQLMPLLVPLLGALLMMSTGVEGGFEISLGHTCGGRKEDPLSCNIGTVADALRYGYMGDLSEDVCRQKCEDMECSCLDFVKDPTHTVRPGESCRICKKGALFMPLGVSHWGYEVQVYSPGWGTPIMLAFGACLAVYLSAGYVYNWRTKGVTGMRALPNATHWLELRSLVFDGVAMAKAGGRSKGRYQPLGGSPAPPVAPAGAGKGRGKEKAAASEGTKGSKKEKTGKEKRSSKERRREQTEPDAAVAPAPAATAPAPAGPAAAPADGTAAGGGGRWVHLSG